MASRVAVLRGLEHGLGAQGGSGMAACLEFLQLADEFLHGGFGDEVALDLEFERLLEEPRAFLAHSPHNRAVVARAAVLHIPEVGKAISYRPSKKLLTCLEGTCLKNESWVETTEIKTKIMIQKGKSLASIGGCCTAMMALTSCMLPSPEMMNQAMGMRGSMGSGGVASADAEEFAKKVITLKVGVATQQDCIALLGKPSMQSDGSLMYNLRNTGSAMPAPASLFFKNGVLSKVLVNKMSMEGGTLNMNSLYDQGEKWGD